MIIYLQNNFKIIFFFFSLLIYSLFSSPTPKYFSIIELLVIFFFLLSLDLSFANFKAFLSKKNLYLLLFFLIVIFFNFSNSRQFYRDLFAILYFLIPIIFLNFFKKEYYRFLPLILCLVGFVIFYRVIIDNYSYQAGISYIQKDLKYLINDPLIQYSIIFLTFYSILYLKKNIKIYFILFCIISFNIFIHLSISASNKIFLINTIYTLMIVCIYSIEKYANKIYRIIFNKNFIYLFIIFLTIIISLLYFSKKFFTLLNSRDLEYQFFYNFIKNATLSEIIVGKGLGSFFLIPWDQNNPVLIGYNHNFVTYILYKLGLVGFFLTFIYFNRLFIFANFNLKNFLNILILKKNNLIFHSSVINLIFSFLYTTNYKAFSIWLILSILIIELRNNLNYEIN
jgi:hypothetical protein